MEEQSNIQQFIKLIPKVYPCETCANDFAEMLVFLIILTLMVSVQLLKLQLINYIFQSV